MRNIALVIKHEILTTLGKPSFWLTTFVLPALVMAFSFGAQFLSTRVFEETAEEALSGAEGEAPLAIGYVDRANLVEAIPADVPSALLIAFPDEAAAQESLDAGKLREYYIIPEDYVASGELLVVESEFAPLGSISTVDMFTYVLDYNLIGEELLAHRISEPDARLQTRSLADTTTNAGADFGARFIVGYGVLFIFFFVLTMSSTFMLRSVSREKENYTVEVLLVSLRPRELMMGKVLGLGTVALLQMVIWLGGSYLTLQRGDSFLSQMGVILSGAIVFPPGFLVWAILYFLLGYILYASLFGAIGALAPNARESGQFTFLAMLPLMVPVWFNTAFIQTPHGVMATVLSLIPLTAPTAMLPRLVTGGVPLWQPIVGLVGLAITTYVLVLVSARFFRADTLLSSTSLTWRRFVEEYGKGK